MKARTVVLALGAGVLAAQAWAHDMSSDIARFHQLTAARKPDSEAALAARLAFERAQAGIEQADVKMLLRIRALTNTGLRHLGEPPASLTSEFKRFEAALAHPKTSDAAKIAAAKESFAQLAAEMKVYTTLETQAVAQMKEALQLMESAPAK